jgi:phospho-N-acetylmuramoyl-pentapeptide-transferase
MLLRATCGEWTPKQVWSDTQIPKSSIINPMLTKIFLTHMSMANTIISTDKFPKIVILGVLGFIASMLLTPVYTTFAYKNKWWKKQSSIATTGEKAVVYARLHAEKHKRNIPAMAGMVGLGATVVVTLLFNLSREQTYLPLAAMTGAGLVGLFDDVMNLRGGNRGLAGMKAGKKLLLTSFVALLGGLYFYFKLDYGSIHIPFIGDWKLGLLIIPLFVAVIVSSVNAVNIADGLDGLAGGLAVSTFGAYTIIAFLQEKYGVAGFCATIVGTLLTYVWFNIYPARFFMSDIGSSALGVALGVVAMLTNTVFILPIIAAVFVVEAGSSALQIASKRLRGKKIFLSAPLHHHFEAVGWPETKVTMRFWVIGQMMAALGVMLAIAGGHIQR